MKNQPRALLFGTCLAVAGMMLTPGRGMAQNYTISNGGSFATVNPGNGTGTLGMNDWSVGNNGVMQNELNQQWFWYQVGTGPVQSIDQLGTMSTPIVSSADGGLNNELTLTYSSTQLSIQIVYELLGTGMNTGAANIQEGITLTGTGLSQNVNFFQYSNFNLLGDPNTLQVFPDGAGGYEGAQQNAGSGDSTGIAESISSPDASNAEASDAATTLAAVETGNLNGNSIEAGSPAGDPDSITLGAGPGDVAWAFEWTAPDGNLNIAKQKQLSVLGIPEPSTFALIALGMGAFGLVRRRRSS